MNISMEVGTESFFHRDLDWMLRVGFDFKSKKMETKIQTSLEDRPGVLIVGSSNVGKRTLISRLISVDFEDASESDSSSQVLVHGWIINTKYYTADVSLWIAHLHEGFSVGTLPVLDCLDALVMVFDLNDVSFYPFNLSLLGFLSSTGIGTTRIGRVQSHFQVFNCELFDKIDCEIRRSCLEWCTEHNIEYIEACASNADFDKCLSVSLVLFPPICGLE
ncbi:hypothetical protein QYF36_001674 [Acer negundo]|nr:hypothetical protein QYF36_001674 [Acer negundo]